MKNNAKNRKLIFIRHKNKIRKSIFKRGIENSVQLLHGVIQFGWRKKTLLEKIYY